MHVAGVILDGDFDARIERCAATGFENFHRVGDACADATLCLAILHRTEHDAIDR